MITSKDRTVRLGRSVDMGFGPNKAFPFVYNFVNKGDDNWRPGLGVVANLVNGMGVIVPAQAGVLNSGVSPVQHVVRLDPDYNFKMLGIKYTVYYVDFRLNVYDWYDDPVGYYYESTDNQTQYGTPLWHYIRASVSFIGDSRYLYGDTVFNPATGPMKLPLPTDVLQGYDVCPVTLRVPYLLPSNGIILFELTNTHPTKDLKVGAGIFGMKIRL